MALPKNISSKRLLEILGEEKLKALEAAYEAHPGTRLRRRDFQQTVGPEAWNMLRTWLFRPGVSISQIASENGLPDSAVYYKLRRISFAVLYQNWDKVAPKEFRTPQTQA